MSVPPCICIGVRFQRVEALAPLGLSNDEMPSTAGGHSRQRLLLLLRASMVVLRMMGCRRLRTHDGEPSPSIFPCRKITQLNTSTRPYCVGYQPKLYVLTYMCTLVKAEGAFVQNRMVRSAASSSCARPVSRRVSDCDRLANTTYDMQTALPIDRCASIMARGSSPITPMSALTLGETGACLPTSRIRRELQNK